MLVGNHLYTHIAPPIRRHNLTHQTQLKPWLFWYRCLKALTNGLIFSLVPAPSQALEYRPSRTTGWPMCAMWLLPPRRFRRYRFKARGTRATLLIWCLRPVPSWMATASVYAHWLTDSTARRAGHRRRLQEVLEMFMKLQ